MNTETTTTRPAGFSGEELRPTVCGRCAACDELITGDRPGLLLASTRDDRRVFRLHLGCRAHRAALAHRANRESQRGLRRAGSPAPLLTSTSSGQDVARWLQWCDCSSDACATYTDDEAWAALEVMLAP